MGRRLHFLARTSAFAVLVGILARFASHLRHGVMPGAALPIEKPTWPPITAPDASEDDTHTATQATDAPVAIDVRAPWVTPLDGRCPDTHQIKVKERSGIYHEPGMLNYDRTSPDRCYRDRAAAEADGFRAAKR